MKKGITLVLWALSSAFIGQGTNAWVGFGVYLALWTIAGFIETTRYDDD